MAINDDTSYELTGYQVKDLAQKIRAKADSNSLASVATSGLYSDLTGAPTIPTVYNGTLTIQQNGTTLGTFSANQDTNETINITGGGSTYTAGNGINITNDEISVDTSVVATQTDLGSYVTLSTNQNITGEKTFVGNKRIKFKGTASNSKCGFTSYDQNNGETGFLEVEGTSTGSKKVRLGCYDGAGGSARDNYLGFQYHNTKPVGGGTVSYNLVCPPQYKGISGTNAFAYIPVDFTDGNTTIRSDTSGIVNLSTILPSYSNFTGATSSVAGTNGLVPAPAAGDEDKVLSGAGTWVTVPGAPETFYIYAGYSAVGSGTAELYSDQSLTTVISDTAVQNAFDSGKRILLAMVDSSTLNSYSSMVWITDSASNTNIQFFARNHLYQWKWTGSSWLQAQII